MKKSESITNQETTHRHLNSNLSSLQYHQSSIKIDKMQDHDSQHRCACNTQNRHKHCNGRSQKLGWKWMDAVTLRTEAGLQAQKLR